MGNGSVCTHKQSLFDFRAESGGQGCSETGLERWKGPRVTDRTGQRTSTNSALNEQSRALGFQNEKITIRFQSADTERHVHKWT